MQNVIGVRFKKAGKIYYFSYGKKEVALGDGVIVETARGIEYGNVVLAPREVPDSDVVLPLKEIMRVATEQDDAKLAANKENEKEAFKICEEKIAEYGLPMKLVDVEYTFDVNKIIFYFTADGRIDFRELVKGLAAVFRTRIELRQIGVRDEAKFLGGFSACGRPLCCATFLGEFIPVSIRMAKEQNLSLNPQKISGVCGRLMCCLKYENDYYAERNAEANANQRRKTLPPTQGSKVITVEGEGKVISLNMQKHNATILLDDSRTIVAAWDDIIEKDEDMGAPNGCPGCKGCAAHEEEEDGEGRGKRRNERRGARERSARTAKPNRRGKVRAEEFDDYEDE